MLAATWRRSEGQSDGPSVQSQGGEVVLDKVSEESRRPVWWEERECGAGAGLWAGSVLSAGLAWPPQAVSSLCTFGTRAAGVVGLMLRSSELWNEDSFARCQPEVGLTFPDGIS